jgi:hypothetical protein
MKKTAITLMVNPSTVTTLRLIAEHEGVRVKRGPGSGQGSVAKLLDKIALEYLLQQVAGQTPTRAKSPQPEQEGA